MKKITLNVSMSCGHCQKRVEGTLSNSVGVSDYFVNLPAKMVDVSFDPNITSTDKIISELDDLGFEVSVKI